MPFPPTSVAATHSARTLRSLLLVASVAFFFAPGDGRSTPGSAGQKFEGELSVIYGDDFETGTGRYFYSIHRAGVSQPVPLAFHRRGARGSELRGHLLESSVSAPGET